MAAGYIKSPMNYTGGKYKLLDDIIPIFPSGMHNFVDLFAGGFNVGINVEADTIYANDQITYIIDLYELFQSTGTDELISMIKSRVQTYGLYETNAAGYNSLRAEYNKSKNLIDLFALTCCCFNNQMRFNKKHCFNMQYGERTFNQSIEGNLIRFCEALHTKNIVFSSGDFLDFDFGVLSPGDVVYCDPPYLTSTAPYNDGMRGFKDWTALEDRALRDLLDHLDRNGIRFVMSNVLCHKGQVNNDLIEWCKKYAVRFINKTYSSCNYHLNDRTGKTVEVIITNFESKEGE